MRQLLASYSVALLLAGHALPEEISPSHPSSSPIVLEKVREQAAAMDQEFPKALNRLSAVVDAEIAAKRLDLYNSQGITSAINAFNTPTLNDFRNLKMAKENMPKPNEAVTAAFQEFDLFFKSFLKQRNDFAADVFQVVWQRSQQAVLAAQKPEDLDPLMDTIKSVEHALIERAPNGISLNRLPTIDQSLQVLKSVQAALAARDTGDPQIIATALNRLRMSYNNEGGVWSTVGVQQRVDSILKPYVEAIPPLQSAVDDQLVAHAPADKLAAALGRFEQAVARLQAVKGNSASEISTHLAIYRSLVAAARAMETKDYQYARTQLGTLRRGLDPLGAERVNKLDAVLSGWQKELNINSGRISEEKRASWAGRLANVKDADELAAIGVEMQKAENEAAANNETDFPRGLGSHVASLASLWSSGNIVPLTSSAAYYETGATPTAYSKEMKALNQRIQREVVSRVLHAPELMKPPLADQPPEVALDTLANDLSVSGQWQRLLELLEFRSDSNRLQYGRPPAMPATSSAITAIRMYLAGQNYEAAEQWGDAIAAYKTALATAASMGPIKESVERIKVLAKEHPKSVPSADIPASSTPSASKPIPSQGSRKR